MALGISIQHVTRDDREDREIRSDHVGFLGVIPEARWPVKARVGDFIELSVTSAEAFGQHRTRPFFDAAARAAVLAFFGNGGQRCTLFGICVRDPHHLADPAVADVALRAVLDRLVDDPHIALLAMPCLAWLPCEDDVQGVHVGADAVVRRLLRHCAQANDQFLLVDVPAGLEDAEAVRWVASLRADPTLDASFGAVYHPWICQGDVVVPPSGAVAGLFARVDRDHAPYGVRVPPANVPLRGFTHTDLDVPWRDAEALLDAGINPLLVQPGRGLVVWGARTMSADVRWRQITARRIVSFIIERVRRDAEWVVFEHLRPELWETVARMVRARLDTFWSVGLLSGASAGEEYVVQCDAALNPPAVRDAGQVHFRVMLRPVATTEFIEIELALGA